MTEAYSKIGVKQKVSAALPWRPGRFLLAFWTFLLVFLSYLCPCDGCHKRRCHWRVHETRDGLRCQG